MPIAQAIIEIALEGMTQVQAELNAVKDMAKEAAKPVSIPIAVRPDQVETQIAKIQVLLNSLGAKPLTIDVTAEIGKAQLALDSLHGRPLVVDVSAEIGKAQAALEQLRAKPLVVDVSADVSKALAALAQLKTKPLTLDLMLQGVEDAQERIDGLKGKDIRLRVLLQNLEDIQEKIDGLKGKDLRVRVLAQGIAEIQKAIDGLTPKEIKVPVEQAGSTWTIQAALDALKANPVYVPVEAVGLDKVGFIINGLKEKFASTKISVEIRAVNEASAVIEGIRKELAMVPSTHKIEFLTEKLDVANAQIAQLDKLLAAVPGDKTIQVALQIASNARAQLKKELADLTGGSPVGIKLDAAKAQEEARALFSQLQAKFGSQELIVKLAVIDEASAYVRNLIATLGNLPKEEKTRLLLENREILVAQLADLKAQLKAMPNNKIIQIRVEATQKAITDINAGLQDVNKFSLEGVRGLQRVSGALLSIGAIGGGVLGSVTAAFYKFASAADPTGWNELQATIAKLSVQIGFIFIPILDKVSNALKSVLDWFRNLTDGQRASIEKWIEIVGIAGAVVLVLGTAGSALVKAAAVVKILGTAIQWLGVQTAIATGGILPIIGAIAGVIAAAAGIGAATGQFGRLEALGQSLAALFAKLKPIVTGLFDAVAGVASGILAVAAPVLEFLGSVPSYIYAILAAVFLLYNGIASGGVGGLVATLVGVVILVGQIRDVMGEIPGAIAAITAAVVIFGIAWKMALGPIGWLIALVGIIASLFAGFSSKKPPKAETEDRFTPKALETKISFTGFLDAFKANQEAAGKFLTPGEQATLEVLNKQYDQQKIIADSIKDGNKGSPFPKGDGRN